MPTRRSPTHAATGRSRSDRRRERTALERTTVTTRRGITCEVLVGAPASGQAEGSVVSFHGATGPLGGEPMLARPRRATSRVYAPIWPGYSEQGGEEKLEDMLDFALHGADVVEALDLHRPASRRALDGRHDRRGDGGRGTRAPTAGSR